MTRIVYSPSATKNDPATSRPGTPNPSADPAAAVDPVDPPVTDEEEEFGEAEREVVEVPGAVDTANEADVVDEVVVPAALATMPGNSSLRHASGTPPAYTA